MRTRPVIRIGVLALAAVVALVVLYLTPLATEGPGGRSYEPAGVAIDLAALAVLIAVAWNLLRDRIGSSRTRDSA